jgi:hypothetical protein
MSNSASGRGFQTSSAKDYLRSEIDRELIRQLHEQHYSSQGLKYIGLPGPELLDILTWREYLKSCTAFEISDAIAEEMELNVVRNRIEGIVEIVRGNIDDWISRMDAVDLSWPYQVINLDYVGGLVNQRDDGTSRRIETLRSVFQRQRGAAFVLFLTLNPRDDDQGELDDFIDQLELDLATYGFSGLESAMEEHRNLGHAGLLKIYVPQVASNCAAHHNLEFLPPVLYTGTKTMIHFAVTCTPYTEMSAGRHVDSTEKIELINLPLLTLHSADGLRKVDIGTIRLIDE